MGTLITDIHAHILPGLDDGPCDLAETRELLAAMRGTGVDHVFCTSHYLSPHFDVNLQKIESSFTRMVSMFERDHAIPELATGAEVRVTSNFVEDIRSGTVRTLGETRYVLIEFPSAEISKQALELIYELTIRSYRPIMAHPERNLALRKTPSLICDLIEAGVLMQATAHCFLKFNKKNHERDKFAWRMLKEGKISVIASDAHNTTTRPPGLIEAYENIADHLGQFVADRLIENANAIWENAKCEPVPKIMKRRRWW